MCDSGKLLPLVPRCDRARPPASSGRDGNSMDQYLPPGPYWSIWKIQYGPHCGSTCGHLQILRFLSSAPPASGQPLQGAGGGWGCNGRDRRSDDSAASRKPPMGRSRFRTLGAPRLNLGRGHRHRALWASRVIRIGVESLTSLLFESALHRGLVCPRRFGRPLLRRRQCGLASLEGLSSPDQGVTNDCTLH